MSAPVGDVSTESDEYLTDAKIDDLQSRLKATPGMSSSAVDEFIEILRKFRKDTPEKEKLVGVVSEVLFPLHRLVNTFYILILLFTRLR